MECEKEKSNGDKHDSDSSTHSLQRKTSTTILPEFDVAAKVRPFMDCHVYIFLWV